MTNNPSAIEAVLFDVDGTLLDTVPLIVETHQYVLRSFLGKTGDEAAILASIGVPLDDFYEKYPPDMADAMIKAYLTYNISHMDTHISIFLKAYRLLKMLADRKVPLAVVTSKRKESALLSLKVFDLLDLFPVVIAKESTIRHKPDAEPALEAMRQLQVTCPENVIFIGDSLHDLFCARQAGCRSAIVDWTLMPTDELRAAGPDLWLEEPEQLLALLD